MSCRFYNRLFPLIVKKFNRQQWAIPGILLFLITIPILAESNPVYNAVISDNAKQLRSVLSSPANLKYLDEPDLDGNSLLFHVQSMAVLNTLLENGIRVKKDDTLILYSIIENWAETYRGMQESEKAVRTLLDRGIDPTLPVYRQYNLLHFSASKNSMEITRMLIQAGVPVSKQDDGGNTPLHNISVNFDFETRFVGKKIDLFLKAGADINARNQSGQTPLHHAVREVVGQTAMELVKRGADINLQDDYGSTPLHDALQESNDMAMMKFMIQNAGAALRLKNKRGQTARDVLNDNHLLEESDREILRREIDSRIKSSSP